MPKTDKEYREYEGYGIVYLVTNTTNGKVYVGQTVESFKSRWRKHTYAARRGQKGRFQDALRKYSYELFDTKIIAVADSQSWLNYLEKTYIKLYNAVNSKYGYNIKHDSHITPEIRNKIGRKDELNHYYRHDVDTNELVSLYKAGFTCKEIGDKFSFTDSAVRHRLKKVGILIRHSHVKVKNIDIQYIIGKFNEGVPVYSIAKELGVSCSVVVNRLETNKIKTNIQPRNKLNKNFYNVISDDQLLQDRAKGLSHQQIGDIYGVDRTTVTRRLWGLESPLSILNINADILTDSWSTTSETNPPSTIMVSQIL